MVNVREFSGGDHIVFSAGTNGMATILHGAFSILMIVKRLSGHTDQGALLDLAAGLSGSRGFFRYTDTNVMNYLRSQFQSPGDGPGISDSDGWCCLAFTKADGTTSVTYHKGVKSVGSTAWTDTVSAGTVEDDDQTCDRMQTRFMEDNSWAARFRVAAYAVYNSKLATGTIHGLDTSYQDMIDASPIWAVKFDQASTGTDVLDSIADGDQSSLVGSSVISEDVPSWTYEGGAVVDPILVGTGSLVDRIMAGLISQGFTTGSLADRERARLLAKLILVEPQPLTLQDLYEQADETNRLAGAELFGAPLP